MKLIDLCMFPEQFSYPLEGNLTPFVDSFMNSSYVTYYIERFNKGPTYLRFSDLEQDGFNHGFN